MRSYTHSRGHDLRLKEGKFKLKEFRRLFSVRARRSWNSLPKSAVASEIRKLRWDVYLNGQKVLDVSSFSLPLGCAIEVGLLYFSNLIYYVIVM